MAPPRKFVREIFHGDKFDDIEDENALRETHSITIIMPSSE